MCDSCLCCEVAGWLPKVPESGPAVEEKSRYASLAIGGRARPSTGGAVNIFKVMEKNPRCQQKKDVKIVNFEIEFEGLARHESDSVPEAGMPL